MVTREETGRIIGICMDVFRELGSGFLEPVYQDAAEIAFRQAGIPFVREAQCPIYFRGVKIQRNYEADFVCYGEVILEFKAVKKLAPEHKAQLINYLKATRISLGYLINFHGDKLTWERIVYTEREDVSRRRTRTAFANARQDLDNASVSAASSARVCG